MEHRTDPKRLKKRHTPDRRQVSTGYIGTWIYVLYLRHKRVKRTVSLALLVIVYP